MTRSARRLWALTNSNPIATTVLGGVLLAGILHLLGWVDVATVLNLITTLAAVAALYFAWQSVRVGNQSVKLSRIARREEARYRSDEHRAREQSHAADEQYRAAVEHAKERERLAEIGQLVAEVRAAATQLRDTQSSTWTMGMVVNYSYILDGPQSKLRAAVLLHPDLSECWKLADRRDNTTAREITPQVVVDCIRLSVTAFEEVEHALRSSTGPATAEQ